MWNPAAILASGDVVALLYHGGPSTAFFEAVAAGVCYARVGMIPMISRGVWRFLGLGVWGE